MSTDKKHKIPNAPNLRFPEFTGEWKEISIGKCCSPLEYGMNAPAKEFDGVNKYIRITDIDEETLLYKKDNIVSPDSVFLEKKYIVKKGDILWARTGASTGKAYLYDEKDGLMYFAGFLIRGNVKATYNSTFVFLQMLTQKYRRWVDVMSVRSGQPGINTHEFSSYTFKIPHSKQEQDKIASFFSLLDVRIQAQIGAIEDLKKLIKGITMTVSQSPNTKNTYLKELLTERVEKNTMRHEVFSVAVNDGVINQIDHLGRSFAANDTSHYNVVHYGDIVYTKSPTGDFPYGIVKRSAINKFVAVSPLYGVYSPVSDDISVYLHHFFESPILTFNYLHKLIQKGAKNTINITNQRFLENYVPVPDRNTLSNYRRTMDILAEKIQNEQHQLSNFRKQKAYLLKNMFV